VNTSEIPLREVLRGLPVFAGVSEKPLDPEALPLNPLKALDAELRIAIEAGEAEPHAMTLSTVSAAGTPSNRVLLCKDVDGTALHFATSSRSRKGQELAGNDRAAVNFYWRGSGRQFRVVGQVAAQDEVVSAADFAARGRGSRIAALVHRDVPPATMQEVLSLAVAADASTPDDAPAPADWVVYALIPEEAELWQARRDRLHHRVVWTRSADGWQRGLLWP
jgi:pyridoxamine 5'-phosphate oxidase